MDAGFIIFSSFKNIYKQQNHKIYLKVIKFIKILKFYIVLPFTKIKNVQIGCINFKIFKYLQY